MAKPSLQELLSARRPDYSSVVSRGAWLALARAATLHDEIARIQKGDALADAILDRYAVDRIAKADATIAALGDHAALQQTAVGAYVASLAPISAGAKLIAAGQRIQLAPQSTVSFPVLADAPQPVAWIGEGAPIPAGSVNFAADTLGPHRKAGVLLVVTTELLQGSDAFNVVDQVLRERAAATIDGAIFSADEGTDTVHSGLLFGADSVSSGGDPVRDVESLVAGLASAGGTGAAMIAANPREAASLRVRLPQLPYEVLETKALAVGTLAAVDPTSFVSSIGEVDILASESAVVHMSDDPAEIVSGTGPTTADPVRSMWQTNCVALRLLLDIAFTSRAGRVVKMENAVWI